MLSSYLKRMSTIISSRDAASFVDGRRYYSMGIGGHCSMNEEVWNRMKVRELVHLSTLFDSYADGHKAMPGR